MSAARDPSDLDPEVAGRYLAGEMPPGERERFERWIADDPARRAEMALVHDLWVAAGHTPDGERVDSMWRSLQGKLRAADRDEAPVRLRAVRQRPVSTRRRFTSLQHSGAWRSLTVPVIAAAAVLLAAHGLVQLRVAPESVSDGTPQPREFRTGPGQRAVIQLTDGTRVALGVASALVVSPFGAGPRDVTLTGEAMFDVVKDDEHPFRVHSSGTVIEDLGTRFAVRAYDEDRDVRVVVTSGAVALHASRAPAARPSLVLAGQLAHFDSLGHLELDVSVDTTRYLAWAHGRVLIQNETLRDAAVEIERWHDVQIVVPDAEVAGLRITVDMRLGSLQKTLEAVTMPLGLRFEIVGRSVRIHR